MDSYKIVSTQEKRGVYFTVVPHQWEKNGILFWPEHIQHTAREKLRSNIKSIPEKGWSEYPCIVKFSGITVFQEALELEKQLSQCIDTDAEELLFMEMHKKKRVRKNFQPVDAGLIVDRNDLFVEYTENKTKSLPSHSFNNNITIETAAAASPETVTAPQIIHQDQEYATIVVGDDGTLDINNILNEATPDIYAEINIIKTEVNNLKNEITAFKTEVKQQMKEDYLKINLNLDKILKILSSQEKPRREEKEDKNKVNLLESIKFPLTSSEDVSLLEEKIRNNHEFRAQLVELLSQIGGRTGVEDGSKIGYKIVDFMFDSKVLMQYSWTGISRGTSGEKKAFQVFDGIVGVFFEVISLADNRHTMKRNCDFFKDGVLKHAKKRTARKRAKSGHDNIIDNNNELPANNINENETNEDIETNEDNETNEDIAGDKNTSEDKA